MKNPQPIVVNMKVLISPNPLDTTQSYFSVAVGKSHTLKDTGCRRVSEKLTGLAFCPSLMYALTQDAVLKAICPKVVKI